jgi:Domain of unknown function (DUF1990)
MFRLSRPNRNAIAAFVSAQQNQAFSYAEVGYSRQQAPKGYVADHHRIQLGKGVEAFERAKCAVRHWKMFDMPWIDLCWPNTPVEPGAHVAVLIAHLGFWSLNACRIVYVVDEDRPSEIRLRLRYPRGPRRTWRREIHCRTEFRSNGLVRLGCVFAAQHACAIGLSVYEVAAETLCQRLKSGHAKGSSIHLKGRLIRSPCLFALPDSGPWAARMVATATSANGNQLGFAEFRHSACLPPALTTMASSAYSLASPTGATFFTKKANPF